MPKTRGNGEGAIFKAGDGRWVARVSLGHGPDGRIPRKEIRCKTKAEALRRLDQARRQQAEGLPPTPERLTVGAFLADWLDNSARPKARERTYESYKSIVDKHLSPALGKIGLGKLGPSDVQRYLNAKLEAGQSARSVQYHRAVLRIALNQALKWGLVARNVAALVDPPRVRRPEVKPLELDQAR